MQLSKDCAQLERRYDLLTVHEDKGFLKYYSQGGQDVIVSALLFNILDNGKNKPVIDIGCAHPKRDSNSYFFQSYFGCDVIGIDPLREYKIEWQRERPNQIFEPYALGNYEGKTEIKITERKTHSYIDKSRSKDNNFVDKREVDITTLSSILDKHNIERVIFCSIDVEGYELKVLKGIDFENYEIACFSIENNIHSACGSEEIRKYLMDKGYKLVARIGTLDDIFLKEEMLDSLSQEV